MPTMKPGSITVLISVYSRSDPNELDETLNSLWGQTLAAESVLIIKDGPTPNKINQVISYHQSHHPELTTIQLEENQGLGPALQQGLAEINTEFFARIDSDDIALPHRLEHQIIFLQDHPDIAVVGTAVIEFDDHIYQKTKNLNLATTEIRSLPEKHDDIVRYCRINSPLNHPSIMARTAIIRQAGGYRQLHFMEDYDLWARLISIGARLHNLPEPLTYFRTSTAQIQRRTGVGMLKPEWQMQRNLISYGIISKPQAIFNLIVRTFYRTIPGPILKKINSILFSKR